MDDSEITLFEHIDYLICSKYASSTNNQGINHYIGNIISGIDDYFDWERNINETTDQLEEYATTYITD